MFIDLLNNKKVGLKTWCTKKKFFIMEAYSWGTV